MKKGILISVEGGEGAGKTIQVNKLRDYFEKNNQSVTVVREPGRTQIGEQIRNVVLSPFNKKITKITEALLFQAARAQLVDEIILPALKTGKIVLCDRFRDSSVVYQGIVRGLGIELIETLNDVSTQKTKPDLVFLLDVPVNIGLARRNGTEKNDRLDLEKKEFHQKVREGYLSWARKNKKRFVMVDASRSIEENHREIIKIIKKRFSL